MSPFSDRCRFQHAYALCLDQLVPGELYGPGPCVLEDLQTLEAAPLGSGRASQQLTVLDYERPRGYFGCQEPIYCMSRFFVAIGRPTPNWWVSSFAATGPRRGQPAEFGRIRQSYCRC